jgi:hypothetical protein
MVVTPARKRVELAPVLSDLAPGHTFDDEAVRHWYSVLGAVVGLWVQEEQRLEAEPLKKALLTMAKNLGEVSNLLNGLETGVRSDMEIAISSHVARLLSIDPTVGSQSKAEELLNSFRQDARRIAHVCLIAAADLPKTPGERGRRPHKWYDIFTALLLQIAEEASLKPTLGTDSSTGEPQGWLLEAALALETFLDSLMRSPSATACLKRLERSRARLQADDKIRLRADQICRRD